MDSSEMSSPAEFFSKLEEFLAQHYETVELEGVCHFIITQTGSWTIDLSSKPPVIKDGTHGTSDVELTFSSEKVFRNFLKGKDLKKDFLTRRLKVRGDTKLLTKLVELASSAAPKHSSGASKSQTSTSDLSNTMRRRRVPSYAHSQVQTNRLEGLNETPTEHHESTKIEWLPDKNVQRCLICDEKFTFIRRKHHCRLCGGIYCYECSSHDVKGERACEMCYERAFGARTRRLKGILGTSTALPPPLVSVTDWKRRLRNKRKQQKPSGTGDTRASKPEQSPSKTGIRSPERKHGTAAAAAASSSVSQKHPGSSASEGQSVGEGTSGYPEEDAGEEEEETSVKFNERLRQLESESKKLKATINAASTPAALHPTFTTVASRSEFWFPFVQVALWVMNVLGWKLGIYGCYLSILFGLFFYNVETVDFVKPVVCKYLSQATIPYTSWSAGDFLCDYIWIKLFVIGTVISCMYIHYIAVSSSDTADLFRRRMRVYGLSLGILADYKITQMYTDQHYEDEDDEVSKEHGESKEEGTAGTENVDQDVVDVDEIWSSLHRRNARRLYYVIRDLKGLWVKSGQYLSSRPDVMPQEYVQVLKTLQDGMPARPLTEIMQTISEDVKQDPDQLFSHIDPYALASASIAQVHKGSLRDGSAVAIKVQHRGMDRILRQDLKNLHHVLTLLGLVSPNLDIKSVMEEWSKEVQNELDFEKEARNMICVRHNMARSGLNVTLPRVIPGLYGPRALVMRFVDGIKVSDRQALDEAGVDREKLVSDVCSAYGCQIYINGVFNGDPHPGNILVVKRKTLRKSEPDLQKLLRDRYQCDPETEKPQVSWQDIHDEPDDETASLLSLAHGHDDDWVPVLIDFGLTKQLNDHMRYAFCQMVISGEEMDYAGVLESFDKMGMKFNRESVSEDLENLQHMFRDAKPADEARKEHAARSKRVKKAREAEKEEGKEERKLEAWPSDLMFFLRASELLQGLCVQLDTRLKFMSVMSGSARIAMLRRFPRHLHAQRNVYPLQENVLASRSLAKNYSMLLSSEGAPASPQKLRKPLSDLEEQLQNILGTLFDQGHILGAQVCVMQEGKVLTDLAAGKMGSLDPRPVTPATLFPIYGVSRAVVAAALNHQLTSGKLSSLDKAVSSFWPEFGAGGKARCTIRELLLCKSGVESYCPEDLSSNHLTTDKWANMLDGVAKAEPSLLTLPTDEKNKASSIVPCGPSNPAELLTHLYLGWGWAVGGLLENLLDSKAGTVLQQVIGELIAVPEEMFCGFQSCSQSDLESFRSRMAGVILGKSERQIDLQSTENTCDFRPNRETLRLPGGLTGEIDSEVARVHIQQSVADDSSEDEEGQNNAVTLSAAMAAMDFAGRMNDSGLEEFGTLTSGGKEHIMDPRVFNMEKLKDVTLPASNIRSSARALAALGDSFFKNISQTEGRNESQLVFNCDVSDQKTREALSRDVERVLYVNGERVDAPAIDMEASKAVVYIPERIPESTSAKIGGVHHVCNIGSVPLEACRSYGFRPVGFKRSDKTEYSGYGMFALGGSLLVTEAKSGTTIAITVNELTADSYVTSYLLEQICQFLKLGSIEA
eukprot:gb/GECG01008356.1/.p1 GENE.gb/GECG01008356.1/~~gb/GECG01008356.1/.p1  ORF type:complete len:1576 (+),score=215.38 gb/GECG01008356.1/:1-4728(+)